MALAGIIGASKAHTNLVARIQQIAGFDAEILISGETGVGKEVYARLIHASGGRFQKPFVPVNCGALPGELFENELFGHTSSAYTGARTDSDGLVAAAEGGTLFLDEVDSLLLPSQIKLLRFIQFREYRRLGETKLRKSSARLIAATNQELGKAVSERRFREDLYYRLRVIPLEVPPLRHRKDDIDAFVDAFTECYAQSYGVTPVTFTPEARNALRDYSWPGNVRELENCIRYVTCMGLDHPAELKDLPIVPVAPAPREIPQELLNLPLRDAKKRLIREFELEYLKQALTGNGGNVARAARACGKNRRAFFELMRQHGLRAVAEVERARRKASTIKVETRAAVPPKEPMTEQSAPAPPLSRMRAKAG